MLNAPHEQNWIQMTSQNTVMGFSSSSTNGISAII